MSSAPANANSRRPDELQILATHWPPASALFGATGMAWADWGVAAGVASSVLLLEEARKPGLRGWRRLRAEPVSLAVKPPPA